MKTEPNDNLDMVVRSTLESSPYEEQDEAGVANMFGLDEFIDIKSEFDQSQNTTYFNQSNLPVYQQEMKPEYHWPQDEHLSSAQFPRYEMKCEPEVFHNQSPPVQFCDLDKKGGVSAVRKRAHPKSGSGIAGKVKTPAVPSHSQQSTTNTESATAGSKTSTITLADTKTGEKFVVGVQYTYICLYCGFKSAHKYNVKRHNVTAHTAEHPTMDPFKMDEQQLYLCTKCNFTSAHKYNTKRHMATTHLSNTGSSSNHQSLDSSLVQSKHSDSDIFISSKKAVNHSQTKEKVKRGKETKKLTNEWPKVSNTQSGSVFLPALPSIPASSILPNTILPVQSQHVSSMTPTSYHPQFQHQSNFIPSHQPQMFTHSHNQSEMFTQNHNQPEMFSHCHNQSQQFTMNQSHPFIPPPFLKSEPTSFQGGMMSNFDHDFNGFPPEYHASHYPQSDVKQEFSNSYSMDDRMGVKQEPTFYSF